MIKTKNFATLILTHGRPHKQYTLNSLLKANYTGPLYFILDDKDPTRKEYQMRYGEDRVIVFSKEEVRGSFDLADNFSGNRGVVFARNAVWKIAKDLGLDYFLVLDDDYTQFQYRFNGDFGYEYLAIKDLDAVLEVLLKFLKNTPAKTITMAQGGDFIGGGEGSFSKTLKLHRKAMNTFLCATDRPFNFYGRINEDATTYAHLVNKGDLFFTVPNVCITQRTTQQNEGGLTELYLDIGTYLKSFYSVIFCPSFIKVAMMGSSHRRLHHKINWPKAVPVIIEEKYRK